MPQQRVLLLHGLAHHRSADHWLWWLAEELRRERIPVQYPQSPSPDEPVLEEWVALAETELEQLGSDPDAERIVVAHSLGTILWQHLASRGLARADRVLLASPPLRERLEGRIAADWLAPIDVLGAIAAVPTTVVLRESDPYRPAMALEYTAGWDANVHVLPGEGHINNEDGHGPFPAALDWVLKGHAFA